LFLVERVAVALERDAAAVGGRSPPATFSVIRLLRERRRKRKRTAPSPPSLLLELTSPRLDKPDARRYPRRAMLLPG
jgi:hypothetical protein